MAFLEHTARQIWEQYGKEVSEHMLLFPSRRSMLYFKRAITDAAGQNLWMPDCLTLERWIKDQSDFVLADTITATYELYQSAKKTGFTDYDFEAFYPLAQIILNDFEEVDMALIDTGVMWQHTSAWQAIADQDGPPDIWREMKESSLKERWVINWNKLNGLYNDFVKRMADGNLATKGMSYRHAITKLPISTLHDYPKIHVIGFSHLTQAEVEVLNYIKSECPVLFYWNVLPEFQQSALDAGENVMKWVDQFGQDLDGFVTEVPDVQIISTSGMVQQIKVVSQLLSNASGDEDNMAVLLPHPSLIDFFLTSFPDNRSKVNISLGYPLIYSTARSLIEWILSLWEAMVKNDGRMERTELERIWSHLFVSDYFRRKDIKQPEPGKLYFTSSDFNGVHHGLALLYKPLYEPREALDRLIDILEELTLHQPDVFHREILRYVAGRLVRLSDVLSRLTDVSIVFLKRLIVEVMQTASVPFRGEPMEGVQVLGVQEVQNLTFDILIIPGMNEEVLPAGKLKSLIPFSLRRHYGLDDLSDMHTIQSYYIWSAMLQARNVYLLHSQSDDMLGAKGLSRYIFQLKYGIDRIVPAEQYLDLMLEGFEQQSKEIHMNREEEKLLHVYLRENGLSPSALNSYITCPFQFFMKYVLRIREDDDVKAGLDDRQMGTVIHDVMEDLYKPFLNKELTPEDMDNIKSRVDSTVHKMYQKLYPRDSSESLRQSQHWVEQEIIIRAVGRFLEYDKNLKGLEINLLEEKLEQYISTDQIKDVKLYGKIDRLDQKQNVFRIIDYKTGSSKLNTYPLTKLWSERNPAHNWQVLFYAYLIKDRLGSTPFEVGHYTLKDKSLYVPLVTNKNVIHTEKELTQFEETLKKVIDEMVNPDIPFMQTDKITRCKYCVFNAFCERQGGS